MPLHRLDLVLINPCSRRAVYQSLAQELAAVEPPVWARLLAAYCQNRSKSVAIIDAEAEELTAGEVADRVQQLDPVLTAVVVYGHQPSASTQNMTAAGQVCGAVKNLMPDSNILLVGGHVAALPERTLREEQADFVAGGEGFATLIALIEAMHQPYPALEKVPGLWYRRENVIHSNPDTALLQNLDREVPGWLGWDLLPMNRYRAHNWHCLGGQDRQPYVSIYTTLGCPYHCDFCCIQAPFRQGEKAAGLPAATNSYRFWSVPSILEQIDYLVDNFGISNFKIADEMFVLNRRHVLDLCAGLKERRHRLNLWAYARVDTIKDDMLEPLREAGFSWLALGIEAGDQGVRASVDKRYSQDQVFEVVQKVQAAGINIMGNYIFGLPEDDADTMQATLDLAVELNCPFANFYSTMAYPGSALYQVAVKQGIPLPRSWTGYAQHARDCLPLPTRHVTAREVLQFRDDAFSFYYTNPNYLNMIESRFGPATLEHMRLMTGLHLERELLNGKMNVPPALLGNTRNRNLAPLAH